MDEEEIPAFKPMTLEVLLAQQMLNMQLQVEAKKLRGKVEQDVLPILLDSMRADLQVTNSDVVAGIATYVAIVDLAQRELTTLPYTASIYVCQALIARFQAEIDHQRAAGGRVESYAPGATSSIDSMILPPTEAPPSEL
jgi:hypothetical protein